MKHPAAPFQLKKPAGMTAAKALIFGGDGGQRLHYATMISIIVLAGLGLGLGLPNDTTVPQPWAAVSAVVGWLYFMTWSISFYPQLIVNFKRKSVVGLSFDFVLLNFLGFVSYTIYTVTLYTDRDIQTQYKERHHGQANGVRINDVIFAAHACVATLVVMLQILIYERGTQVLSKACIISAACIVASCSAVMVAAQSNAFPQIQTLDLMYFVGYIKVGITLSKYLPQAVLNWRRQSTAGFAIDPVLCDFTGSIFSTAQQALDSIALQDWSVMFGNGVKLAISVVSILYDILLMTQHYLLYPEAARATMAPGGQEAKPLLPDEAADIEAAADSAQTAPLVLSRVD